MIHEVEVTKKVLKKARPIIDRYWSAMDDSEKQTWLRMEEYRAQHDKYQNTGTVERFVEAIEKRVQREADKEERMAANAAREERRQRELDEAESIGIAIAKAIKELRKDDPRD